MVPSLSDLRAALYFRLNRFYWAFLWKDLHPLAREPGAEQTVLGRVFQQWLPTPSKKSLAALADVVELRKDPAIAQALEALLQRAAAVDSKLKKHLRELATHAQELGRLEPGCNVLAVQAAVELDELLAAPDESWLALDDLLGEEHCHPVDLLVVTWSRLLAKRGDERALLTVMSRLRESVDALVMADPELSMELKRRLIFRRSDQELLLFRHRVGGFEWGLDDLARLRAGLFDGPVEGY